MHSLKLILTNPRYFSVAWVFCTLNIMIGTWVLYIPFIKEKFALNDAEIGFALFCLALGNLCFLPLAPILIRKIGLGKYTIIGVILFSISFIGPLLATYYEILCSLLFIVGVFTGTTDVAMNALVSEMEKEDNVNFMSSAHGFFSLGGVIGGAIGALFMSYFSLPIYHMISMTLLVIVVNLFLFKNYVSIEEQKIKKTAKSSQSIFNLKPLFIIAFLALVCMSSEGAIEHWSTLFFKEILEIQKENLAGIGFVVFSITMTIGRFFGDRISERIGSIRIILLGCTLAILGYFCVITSTVIITTIGFGIIGLGLSVVIPELFRIAGKTEGISASAGLSFVSGTGIIGFLLGPVILGYISDAISLRASFVFLLILTVFALSITMLKFQRKRKINNN